MMAMVVGLIFILLGLWGIITWRDSFLMVLKGIVPLMLVCGGLLSLIAGVTAIKDKISAPKVENKSE
jgi:hypothetical protein